MANPFVTAEVEKILNNKELDFPINQAFACAWIIANYKGSDIKIFDHSGTSSLCDFNLVATASNPMQAKTIVDEISYNLKKNGASVLSLEGVSSGDWILVDLGDIIVHIFQTSTREIYDLDSLWKTAPQIAIPKEYYFAHPEMQNSKQENSEENYF